MSDNKGQIVIETGYEHTSYECNTPKVTVYDLMEMKQFCQKCGSKDIDLKRQIVFGNPGVIFNATCRNCGHRF